MGGEGTGALREGEGHMYYADAAGESVRAVKGSRSLNGEKVTTWTRVVAGGNVMEAEAGTNAAFASRGPSGLSGARAAQGGGRRGDRRGRTYLRLEDKGGTDWYASLDGRTLFCPRRVELVLEGDAELAAFKEVLRWWLTVLEAQSE